MTSSARAFEACGQKLTGTAPALASDDILLVVTHTNQTLPLLSLGRMALPNRPLCLQLDDWMEAFEKQEEEAKSAAAKDAEEGWTVVNRKPVGAFAAVE